MGDHNHGEFSAEPEVEEHQPSCLSNFFRFVYNRNTKQFMGRTGCSWFKIIVFYLIFYSCLAGFFVGMLSVFMYGVLVEQKPFRTGDSSLLMMNPGLGFRPMPSLDSTLIEFTAGQPASYARLIANLQELYDMYRLIEMKPDTSYVRSACEPDSPPDFYPDKICKFKWNQTLPGCLPENDFGYAIGEPCVILKLNKIYGWLPDPIDETAPHPLVTCRGENPADRENIGEIAYLPYTTSNYTGKLTTYGFFNQAFYPYLKQVGYRSPLVAVRFKNLRPNLLVMVECLVANLRNSQYSKEQREAMVRFEIFMKK